MPDKEFDDTIAQLKLEYNVNDDLFVFNEMDIQSHLASIASKIIEYTEHYQREKNDLDRILELKEKIVGKRYDYYRFNYDKELKPSEIEKYYLPKDDQIIKINTIIRQQQWRVDFFDGVRRALEKKQWVMSTFINSIKAGL